MPQTQVRHALCQNRLAMVGPAESIRMAKLNPKMMIPQVANPKLKWNGRVEWTLMKRWVTDEKAEMEQEDIDRELFELAREWMAVSKLRKLPGHVAKETDVALWKQFREYPKHKGAILVRLFRCPLRHRCRFLPGIRSMEDADWLQLDRCCEHNTNCHGEEKSKYLKYDAQ